MFAKTPSFEPAPMTRVERGAGVGCGCTGERGVCGVEFWRTRRWRSSDSSSVPSSVSSKASARVVSTWWVGDDGREWKDGGGEDGIGVRKEGGSSSWTFIWWVVS